MKEDVGMQDVYYTEVNNAVAEFYQCKKKKQTDHASIIVLFNPIKDCQEYVEQVAFVKLQLYFCDRMSWLSSWRCVLRVYGKLRGLNS